MRWFKTFIVFIFLGVYFFNITPVHFILHNSVVEASHTAQPLQDCKYVKLMAHGQDTFLNAVDVASIESITLEPIAVAINTFSPTLISSKLQRNFSLRAPPCV